MKVPQKEIRQVAVRKDVFDRLREYIKSQPLPPKQVDVASYAIERYLNEQEQKE